MPLMDGDFLLDLLRVLLNVVLELISLLAFPTLVDTTTVFANKVLSMLLCVLALVLFCLVHGRSDKMGQMRNNDPVSKELISMQHIVLLGVAPLRRINLLLGFLISGRDCGRHVDK